MKYRGRGDDASAGPGPGPGVGSSEGGGGTHAETEAGILHLTRLLAKADGRSGFKTLFGERDPLGSAAGAVDPARVVGGDDGFDVIGAWLNDDDDDVVVGGGGGGFGSGSGGESRGGGGAARAARAGLLALPLMRTCR